MSSEFRQNITYLMQLPTPRVRAKVYHVKKTNLSWMTQNINKQHS